MQTRSTPDTRIDEVARWREERLAASGFSAALADEIAADSRYDLHALIEIVERGCRPDLAARILAPLTDDGAALAVSRTLR